MTDELFMLITRNIYDYVKKKSTPTFVEQLLVESLDIIKRKQTEIERLHEVINGFEEQSHKELMDFMSLSEKYQKAKTEAYKEFAEEFEKRCIASGVYPAVTKNILKNLVKELTEEQNNV